MANKVINDYTIKRYAELEEELSFTKDDNSKKYKKLLDLKCKYGGFVEKIKQFNTLTMAIRH